MRNLKHTTRRAAIGGLEQLDDRIALSGVGAAFVAPQTPLPPFVFNHYSNLYTPDGHLQNHPAPAGQGSSGHAAIAAATPDASASSHTRDRSPFFGPTPPTPAADGHFAKASVGITSNVTVFPQVNSRNPFFGPTPSVPAADGHIMR